MIQRARDGYYSDFDSEIALPIVQLVKDAERHGLYAIARQAKAGKYDATMEESEAWAARTYATDPRMKALMDQMGLQPRKVQ